MGNDTGPMHVAAASGTPVIALFGPADPQRSRPRGRDHIIIKKNLPCSPCSRIVCKELNCMKAITVEEVVQAVRAQLKRIEESQRQDSPVTEVEKEVEQGNSSTV